MAKDITPLSPDRRPSGRLPAPGSGLAAAIYNRPAAAAQQAPDDWERVFAAVRHRKWLVLLVAVLGTAAGVVVARVVRPSYEARAIVWVAVPDRGRLPGQGPIEGGQLLGSSSGWLEVLRSDVVLRDVVREQRLYLRLKSPADSGVVASFGIKDLVRPGKYKVTVDPAGQHFTLIDTDTKAVLQQGTVGDSVGAGQGFAWAPAAASLVPGSVLQFTITSPGDAAVKLAEDLRVKQSEDGSFVNVAWRAHDANVAVATVNGVVDRVVAVAADLRRQRLSELSRILADQRDQAQKNLRSAEAALTAFRIHHATRQPEVLAAAAGPGAGAPPDPMLTNYLDSRVTASQLARDRQAILDLLVQGADSGISVDGLSMITAVQHSAELNDALKELTSKQAELRALRFRYADTHPPVQRLAAQIDTLQRAVIPRLARTLANGLALQERQLSQRADSLTGELRGAPPLALEETRLERDQGNAAQLFSNLQQRYDEARLAEVSSLPDMRVLERAARLEKPVANLAPLIILLAFFSSLGVGTLGAVALDRVDRKVRNPEAVSRAMGVPILGAVPRVGKDGTAEPGGDMMKAVEALRGLRLSVQHAYGAAGPILITVSSPGRGEGKSFVTSNLAQAFADVGFRTLLIDGDVRLGGLHRSLRAQRRPGLTDVLGGNIPAETAVQATAHPLLFFLGCGSRMHRGPELLSTPAVPRLLTGLRSAYDVILVDSAPLGAGVDPYALGTATGSMLLVLRTGVSDRAIAEAKVEVLHRMPIRLLGVILNDVRPGPVYSYYAYSLSGYEIEQEDPHGVAGGILLPDRT